MDAPALLFGLLWLAGLLNGVASYRSTTRFMRLQFLAFALAMFSGAAFYTFVLFARPTPVAEEVIQAQALSRVVWSAVATIHCTVPIAWMVRGDGCS